MTAPMDSRPGFYVDTSCNETMRWWDGERWGDQVHPFVVPPTQPLSFWTTVRAVALGVLIATVVAGLLFGLA